MGRVKILRVIARLNIGGPAVHVINLCAGLDAQHFETTLVCGDVGLHEGDMGYLAAAAGVQPVVMPALQRAIAPITDLVAHLRYARFYCRRLAVAVSLLRSVCASRQQVARRSWLYSVLQRQ